MPDFYRGVAKIRRVIFKVVPDQNVILTQLRSGEIQYALLQPRDLAAVQNMAGLRVVESLTPRFYDLTMNFQRAYWQDHRVREAVLAAMDREGIVQKVLLGHAQVVHANATTCPGSTRQTSPDTRTILRGRSSSLTMRAGVQAATVSGQRTASVSASR